MWFKKEGSKKSRLLKQLKAAKAKDQLLKTARLGGKLLLTF